MKKATNSKSRGKISKLFQIMQEHFGKSMNLARIKLMTLLLEAPVKAQTVNLVKYGLMEIESVLQRTCDKDKYHIFKFLSCT